MPGHGGRGTGGAARGRGLPARLSRPRVKANLLAVSMSKAQLMAFLAKAEATPAIQQQVDAAADGSAVVAIARAEGFLFSPACLARHLRG